MVDLEIAKIEFEKYVNQYNLESPKMKRKLGHSYRVMENAGEIAESLNLDKEEIEVAKLIGLLHDIAKFGQKYNDDHGDMGAQFLRESNYIRKYIEDDKYDDIILKAIKNHNKFQIEEGLTDKELLFAKIIRDADKLDIFYEGAEMFWNTEEERQNISKSTITPERWEEFQVRTPIDRNKIKTPADGILNFIGFLFDVKFEYTKEQIKEQNYINKILDKFDFEDEETAKQMEEIRGLLINL